MRKNCREFPSSNCWAFRLCDLMAGKLLDTLQFNAICILPWLKKKRKKLKLGQRTNELWVLDGNVMGLKENRSGWGGGKVWVRWVSWFTAICSDCSGGREKLLIKTICRVIVLLLLSKRVHRHIPQKKLS